MFACLGGRRIRLMDALLALAHGTRIRNARERHKHPRCERDPLRSRRSGLVFGMAIRVKAPEQPRDYTAFANAWRIASEEYGDGAQVRGLASLRKDVARERVLCKMTPNNCPEKGRAIMQNIPRT